MRYEKYYLEIVKTINDQVQKKWPALTHVGTRCTVSPQEPNTLQNMFAWANDRVPELYIQERILDAELNTLWNNTPPTPSLEGNKNFEAFKAKVLAWGRVILQMYQKFSKYE